MKKKSSAEDLKKKNGEWGFSYLAVLPKYLKSGSENCVLPSEKDSTQSNEAKGHLKGKFWKQQSPEGLRPKILE